MYNFNFEDMAGKENLKDIRTRSTEEVREIGRKGGIASGEARREKRTFSEMVQKISAMGAPSKVLKALKEQGINEEDATFQAATVLKMFHEAMSGNVAAFNAIVNVSGEVVNRHELTGKDGEPLQVEKQMSMEEVREKLRELDEV